MDKNKPPMYDKGDRIYIFTETTNNEWIPHNINQQFNISFMNYRMIKYCGFSTIVIQKLENTFILHSFYTE